jgi:hypothetical protein
MWILAAAYSRAVIGAAEPTASVPAPPLDKLMVFGFMSAVFTLAQAAFAFLYGAWPIGLVALVGAGMAAHWWWRQSPRAIHRHDQKLRAVRSAAYANALSESRLSRIFRSAFGKGSVEDN